MARRFIFGAIVVALLLVGVNDMWRYIQAQQQLRDTTYTIARWAAENAPAMKRDKVANQIVALAASDGVTVTMYGQNDQGVQVWTQKEVSGTIAAATVVNMLLGKSFSEAGKTPLLVKDYREAGIK